MAAQDHTQSLQSTIERDVANIVTQKATQELLSAYGLKAHTVTWEDTGRTKGSCWGPNISDMTLAVKEDRAASGVKLMPVIRTPNFADVTQDVPIETFKLNYKGTVTTLKAVLEDLKLLDVRDTQVLTSSQCCVLPVVPKQKTQFAVQLFNYQSYDEDPAVLVILASKSGTSVQVLNSSNTKLFFDDLGTARWFSVERLEDVRIRAGAQKTRVDSFKEMTNDEKLDNTIMMIQVPLRQKPRPKSRGMYFGGGNPAACAMMSSNAYGYEEESCDGYESTVCLGDGLECCSEPVVYRSMSLAPKRKAYGMDMGQIGLGDTAGPYTGTKGVTLTRNPDFPIRCTFQYYRVTDDGNIDEKSIVDIKAQLDQSLKVATNQGSLVLGGASDRVTEPVLPAPKPTIVDHPNPWVNFNTATPTAPQMATFL